MKEMLAQMIKLQELTFARLEHEAANSRMNLREIQSSMERIFRDLPDQWGRLIRRLQSGGQPAVVPAVDGFCSFCRIQLPTSMVQTIQANQTIHQCPCCARILYVPQGRGRAVGMVHPDAGKGGIARFSSPQLMLNNLKANDRDSALGEMVQLLEKTGWVNRSEEILKQAIEREELVPTALDYGLAFPHARGVEGAGLIVTLGLKRKGLRFGAPAGRLTRIIFFSVIPQAASGFYLKLVAGLVRIFRQETERKKILACRDQEETWETLLELTAEAVL